ncbi:MULTISPECIES: ABC transporter substrate-binding protein [unclassified Microbacterium]|uniref:ABC transporter substrate-binding protein n=1 Tax=unclassified Microbacterium TaxID=2609290 RepID=UPI00214C6F26|nr:MULTISPECIES: ABC transporter substrate-binding protein [unclassified Microbacterium]MCR2811254.1 ABC transporter substrate-binding protein [Microbacterium sp. zg.B185]WIM19853.1 ABC transporter substrate-binding protein [Microbacterium sp. zg-B185]
MTRIRKSGRSAVRLIGTLALATGIVVSAAGCAGGGGGDAAPDTASGEPTPGGEITVLLDAGFAGGWATGLDPATSNTTGSNLPQNAAIFGGLFTLEPDGDGGQIVPNQAESFEWSEDGRTLSITLRDGITFSDGTPLNAEAVVWNWIRALNSGSTGAPRLQLNVDTPAPALSEAFMTSLWAALPADVDKATVQKQLGAIQAVDDLTVSLALRNVDGSLVNGFPTSSFNLIASPTAYAEMGGDAFSLKPVGAGPFIVTADSLSERLELEKNPDYFKSGLPYLDAINFQSVAGDQVAYQTLLAGQGDVIEGLSSVPLITEAKANPDVAVHLGAPTSPYVVQLNSRTAPFDDIKAREAIYYATDFAAINKGLFKDEGEMSQSFTASGGLFFNPEVPGYREYDLDKAKALVEEIGGLTVNLGTTDIVTARSVTTALQTQWEEAGIDVEISAEPLGDVITRFVTGDWQALLQTAGAWDPSVGIGVGIRFGSTSPYSGAPLPEGATSGADALAKGLETELDVLLREAVGTNDYDERDAKYQEIAKYISDQAYAPFGMAFSPAQVLRAGVHGPGLDVPIPALSVNQGVLYDRVWVESGK